MKLYQHIKKDSRHEQVALLSKGEIAHRHFPSWHMGYKDVSTSGVELETKATTIEVEAFNRLLKGESEASESTKDLSILTKFYNII